MGKMDKNDRSDQNEPKWKMNALMTSTMIYNIYGIDECDLPIGSRYKHKHFRSGINANNKALHPNISVTNWSRMPLIQSQQYQGGRPNYNDFDLNKAIKESIDSIKNNKGKLSLIPIIRVDTKKKIIHCETLIPIKVPNQSKWIAISYKTLTSPPYRTVVTAVYIDCDDIINKAALVDPNAIHTFKWLKGEQQNDNIGNNPADQSLFIQSLQNSLNEGLKRENLLFS